MCLPIEAEQRAEEAVDEAEYLERLEPLTKIYYDDFRICPNCQQVYWKGSHYEHMLELIEHHLLMPSVSQRRDLDDPAVIRQFARKVQTPETLALLTLHSFVDAQATSDKLWNGFKDVLLNTLHYKAMTLMSGGAEFARAEEKQREHLMAEVRHLAPEHLSEEELQAHFVALPPRYFQTHRTGDLMSRATNDLNAVRMTVGPAVMYSANSL